MKVDALWLTASAAAVSILALLVRHRRFAALLSSATSSGAAAVQVRPEFVLFGDSITQQSFGPGGWGAAVANAYCRTADIRLRGYSGYNTRWALHALPAIFPPGAAVAPALVTILLGANDANLPAPLRNQPLAASRQYVPLDEYMDNLRAIVAAVRATGDGSARILLITPPPCDGADWLAYCRRNYADLHPDAESNRNFENTAKYAEACLAVGRREGVPTLDLHAKFVERADWSSYMSDGLHPNAKGGQLISEAVLDAVQRHFPELQPSSYGDDDPSKLDLDFPDHKEIDPLYHEESFVRHRKHGNRASSQTPTQTH